jgi:hypothetical protein
MEPMEALVITATLFGSLAGAFVLQKAALAGLIRILRSDRSLEE